MPCWFAGLRAHVWREVVGEDPGVWEQQLPCPAAAPIDLAPALPALCRSSPAGNTSRNTFPHPSPGANPAQPLPVPTSKRHWGGTGTLPTCDAAPHPAQELQPAFMGEETGGKSRVPGSARGQRPRIPVRPAARPRYQHARAVCWKRAAAGLGDPTLPSFPGSRSLRA